MEGTNRLAHEPSPYLRQHAGNPVEWYPWGDEAFAAARERDVPILLSVGYSACHWCHVMAHESFESPQVAAVMNELFVNVKVDREERPDVDAVYMEAVLAMTGHGGWPMTVFMAPDGRPFYGGTYYPPEPRGGMPGFVQLLRAIDDAWRNRRDGIFEQADQLTAALGRSGRVPAGAAVPGPEVLDAAYRVLASNHDDEWGGFGTAPKFPTPQNPDLLVGALGRTGSANTRRMVETTLDAMASGGMYDHLGGGFARYSVDRFWLVPHFEKMLYDQAGMVRLYAHAALVTGHDRYRQVVEETVEYVLRDLQLAGGGIASAEDADSLDERGHSEEGAFYTFTRDEVREALAFADCEDVVELAMEFWEFDEDPNFEGRWIPVRIRHRGLWERTEPLDEARRVLLEHRSRRPRPGLDDKVLTEWNAMWVSALAEAGMLLGRPDWVDAASRTASFLLGALRGADGRWMRSWQTDAGARTLAFAADHAALVDAFTRLGEATGRATWTAAAIETADGLLDRFWDAEHGGLFTTAHDGEHLVTRDKDLQDNAVPSANSVAALALLRLSALTGIQRHRDRAEDIMRLSGVFAAEAPTAFGVLLQALDLHHRGTTEVVVVGDRPDLVRAVQQRHHPDVVLAWGERYESPLWEGRTDEAAYVCRGHVCSLPATTVEDLERRLA